MIGLVMLDEIRGLPEGQGQLTLHHLPGWHFLSRKALEDGPSNGASDEGGTEPTPDVPALEQA